MKISVIISHTRESISECLDSLVSQTLSHDLFEVIVVGDAPHHIPDRSYGFEVRYQRCEDYNPSLRRNLGMKSSNADLYAFIDDDARAAPTWLEAGVGLFEQDDRLAVIGGPTLLPEGLGLAHQLTYKIAHAGFFGNGHENLKQDSDKARDVLGYINCCNLLVFPARLSQTESFEIQVGYGGEDTLFLYRTLARNNCRVLHSTSLIVYHSRGRYGLDFLKTRLHYRQNNGMMLWVLPKIYLGNRKFFLGMILATVLLGLAFVWPLSIFAIAAVHLTVSFLYALRYWPTEWRLTFLFPPALLLHHITYYVGVVTGIFSIVLPRHFRRVRLLRSALK